MRKEVFLEYKSGSYDMEKLMNAGVTGLMVWMGHLSKEKWDNLCQSSLDLEIVIASFDHGVCPLDPQAKETLKKRISKSLSYEPKFIWFDHFRFDGYWEAERNGRIPDTHTDCKWCEQKDRSIEMAGIARWVRTQVPDSIKVGYFAVPFMEEEIPALNSLLGQDHKILGLHFDLISPMLYHRMFGKALTYISDYVGYLNKVARKPVLPIIQVKDMPDDLEDKLTFSGMKKQFKEAIKKPSVGVSWFSWDAAIEKGKTKAIGKLFNRV